MSLAGCCCGPQPSLPCNSCNGGNPCYPWQPAACIAGDISRKYRLTATGGKVLTDWRYVRSRASADYQCTAANGTFPPCQALVDLCTGCFATSFPIGFCNHQSIITDLCSHENRACSKTVIADLIERERLTPHQWFKSDLANPHYTPISGGLAQSSSCGAPLSYTPLICGSYPVCLPCSVSMPPISIGLCNGPLVGTTSDCEESPSFEWISQSPSTATLELEIFCYATTNPIGFLNISGTGVGATYFRRVAARQSAVGQICQTPLPNMQIRSDWATGIVLGQDGFPNSLDSQFEAAPNTLARTITEPNCPTLDAIHITFDGFATFRYLPLGGPPAAATTYRAGVMGIYYGCPDLDVFGQSNPRSKIRTFTLDRWTTRTRMTYGGMSDQLTCSTPNTCGNYASFPLPNSSCGQGLGGAAAALRDRLQNPPPPTFSSLKELFCASDTISPPIAEEDRYGCWFPPSHEACPIPPQFDLVRQGSW